MKNVLTNATKVYMIGLNEYGACLGVKYGYRFYLFLNTTVKSIAFFVREIMSWTANAGCG